MMSPHSRRSLLQSSGAVGLMVFLGGCSALEADQSGLELGDILVRNAHADAHTVRVELERDDELVVEETVEVAGDGGVETIEATWSRDPAVYTLYYAVTGPDEELNIYTRQITGEDEPDDAACAVAAITMGTGPGDRPYVTVGSPETLGGTCSPE